ncbi:ABC transporter substrate-binding protein [Ferruginibacter albus]|uniref:ABC transporter substrate-binding protein n=1 Tax=Ferruginibacter albus TaxID=2875540 RepID=UPI001CC701DF|nr:ABC transporter substrate-binding protein [Ferruginibacter albus]UAY52656.1 ABC transporter substrate-binding protein [Ferruginibacter albus]
MIRRVCLAIVLLLTISHTLIAQTNSKTYHVGIFAPLYLDSVFNNQTFLYKQGIPKFIIPGLDFVQGAEIALDSMDINGATVNAAVYDSKSYSDPVSELIKNKKLDALNLIIGSVKDEEYKELAAFASQKHIPFISVTYPNDGGITDNPYLVIVNSTLKSHCEAIFSYLLQNHGTDKLFLVRKKGTQEDRIAGYIKKINEQDGKPLLNIQTLVYDNELSSDILKQKLDSNRHTVIIGGSLDETFCSSLMYACNELNQTYPITLIGMPNWDGFKVLAKKDLKDFPVYYTSPYFNNKWDDYSKILTGAYAERYKGRPSDMSFKGFEATYLFTKLLLLHPDDLMQHLNDNTYKVFSDFNFRPIELNKESTQPDYFENKHLYFVKSLNGIISKAW